METAWVKGCQPPSRPATAWHAIGFEKLVRHAHHTHLHVSPHDHDRELPYGDQHRISQTQLPEEGVRGQACVEQHQAADAGSVEPW